MRNQPTISYIFIFICMLLTSMQSIAQNAIESVRVWPSPESTRIVFDMSDKPDYSYFVLKNPLRLVIDLENTKQQKDFRVFLTNIEL